MGQCSQALRNRLEAHAEWDNINTQTEVIGLLRIIQGCMTQKQTRKNEVHSLVEAEALVFSYKQGRNTSDNDYYEKFKDNVTTAERMGGSIGV